jgi:toxin ParE1/3/4
MKGKPVLPRAAAQQDVIDAIDHYLDEAGAQVALGFVDALESAYRHIANAPATGSPRFAHELGLAGMRSWALARFPYLVFYFEREDGIDVWRVPHTARDIAAWMQEDS